MKALVLNELEASLNLEERPDLLPEKGQVVIKLEAAALNRRDYWITRGMYPGIKLPAVLGSDGTGTVTDLGADVSPDWRGQSVVINPGWFWGASNEFQSEKFQILGMPIDGTFAQQVAVPVEYVHRRPTHLDATHAAALPLAGVTGFRALFTQAKLKAGENVLVTGAGGGVATFLIQFAAAAGANVYVTSSSRQKIDNAIQLGAKSGFDYQKDGWSKQLVAETGPMNVIIDSAGGKGYADLLNIGAPGARIVNYGATAGPPEKVDFFKLFWKQLHLIGTTMGSPEDFAAMLKFVEQHKIQPVIDSVTPLGDGNEALKKMGSSSQIGKLVLEI